MAATALRTLRSTALAIVIATAAALTGCATRYDSQGNTIYRWQFGQDNERAVDYSNPRLPILPRQVPNYELWPIPSPYQFRDLSQYSLLVPDEPLDVTIARVGDNARCAAPCDPTAPRALLAARAGADDDRRASAQR